MIFTRWIVIYSVDSAIQRLSNWHLRWISNSIAQGSTFHKRKFYGFRNLDYLTMGQRFSGSSRLEVPYERIVHWLESGHWEAVFYIMLDRQSLTRSSYRCGKFNHRYPYLMRENRCVLKKTLFLFYLWCVLSIFLLLQRNTCLDVLAISLIPLYYI